MPRSFWLPDDQGRRILYTMIHKNGSTPFRFYIQTRTGRPFDSRATDRLLNKRTTLKRSDYDIALFVYRDPFDRAVSGFINKFVDKVGTKRVYKNYRRHSVTPPEQTSFIDFLSYIAASKGIVDGHFKAQRDHLMPIAYTHPVAVKHINRAMDRILGPQHGSDLFLYKSNHTHYGTHRFDGICDAPASELQRLAQSGQHLHPDAFKTPTTERIVKDIYARDYDMIRDIAALPKGASYQPV